MNVLHLNSTAGNEIVKLEQVVSPRFWFGAEFDKEYLRQYVRYTAALDSILNMNKDGRAFGIIDSPIPAVLKTDVQEPHLFG